MQWLRLYDDLLDDPKAQQLRPELFKYWINLLCLANKGTPRGALPGTNAIAFRLRLTVAKASAVIEELCLAGLIDCNGETLHPHNWDGRQRKSDNVAERVAKHRRNVTGNVTETVDVTAPDTDTDTDTDTEPFRPPGVPRKNGPAPSPVGEPPKPRTEKQLKADALYEQKMRIVEAYFRGLGVEPDTLPWTQRKSPSLAALGPPIVASAECTPEIIEPLTRYTKAAYEWRHGKRLPTLGEVLTAFAEWNELGRPEHPPPRSQRATGRSSPTPGLPTARDFAERAKDLERRGL